MRFNTHGLIAVLQLSLVIHYNEGAGGNNSSVSRETNVSVPMINLTMTNCTDNGLHCDANATCTIVDDNFQCQCNGNTINCEVKGKGKGKKGIGKGLGKGNKDKGIGKGNKGKGKGSRCGDQNGTNCTSKGKGNKGKGKGSRCGDQNGTNCTSNGRGKGNGSGGQNGTNYTTTNKGNGSGGQNGTNDTNTKKIKGNRCGGEFLTNVKMVCKSSSSSSSSSYSSYSSSSSSCKVLVSNMTGKNCRTYCEDHGLECAGAWEDQGNSCVVREELNCGELYKLLTSDLICECVKNQDKVTVTMTLGLEYASVLNLSQISIEKQKIKDAALSESLHTEIYVTMALETPGQKWGRHLLSVMYDVEILYLFSDESQAELFVENGATALSESIQEATNVQVIIIEKPKILNKPKEAQVTSSPVTELVTMGIIFTLLFAIVLCFIKYRNLKRATYIHEKYNAIEIEMSI